jgi:hypothetical protein
MRSKAELIQRIDDDLIWRRRELTDFRAVIQAAANASRKSALLRAGVALLYAHWEGFVKRSGTYYLQFVSNQGKKGSELAFNFIGIRLKAQLTAAAASKKATATAELVEFFCSRMDERLRVPHKGVVDTESNLSSTVLEEIVGTLGLDMLPFITKRHLIDTSLVNRRNHIAHGAFLDVELEDYLALHDELHL